MTKNVDDDNNEMDDDKRWCSRCYEVAILVFDGERVRAALSSRVKRCAFRPLLTTPRSHEFVRAQRARARARSLARPPARMRSSVFDNAAKSTEATARVEHLARARVLSGAPQC